MTTPHPSTVSVAIAGAAGRMGQRLVARALETYSIRLAAAYEAPSHPALGQDAAQLAGLPSCGVKITGDVPRNVDVIIDFTVPQATRSHLELAAKHRLALVIGTTGLSDDDHRLIDAAAKTAPILQAPNMSLGVNLLFTLAARAAARLGPDYDIEILEAHHRFKKDAPSGTAMGIAQAICAATGKDPKADLVYSRHGHDDPRVGGKITMQTLRMGDVVGDHTVYFATLGERVELRHVATSRDTFANGALRAALWLKGKPAGRYTMADVLDLHS